MDLRQGLRIVLIPEGGGAPRTLSLGRWPARLALLGVAGALTVLAILLVVGGLLVARAARVGGLEAEIARLQGELAQVDALVERLEEIEAQYGQIQELFGAGIAFEEDLWLPLGEEGVGAAAPDEVEGEPSLWPLTERGFVTQSLLEGGGEHSGLDIAVAEGSYIRASGGGTVAESGNDPVLGRFLRIQHADDVETLYAHASMLLVRAGDTVRAGDVIGTTGSTGRSSAPHLHFEVRVAGVNIDPLTRVDRP